MAPSGTDKLLADPEGKQAPGARADNLGEQYSKAADDGLQSAKRREAAMLYSIAEGHLDDDAPEEVLKTIADAIKIFKEIGDNEGLADSLRLQMHGYSDRAMAEFNKGRGDKEESTLHEAERIMREELGNFRALNIKRGEAAMLLAVGEVLTRLGGSARMTEAIDYVMDAQDAARELGDLKLEADSVLRKCEILQKRRRYKLAIQAAKEAQKLFSAVGDQRNEAFSWKHLGTAQIENGRVEDGFVSLRKAMSIYRRTGNRKQEGVLLLQLAELYDVERVEFGMALKAAEEAQAIFKELDDRVRGAQARIKAINASSKLGDYAKAEQLAKDGAVYATDANVKTEAFDMIKALADVHNDKRAYDDALTTAEELVDLAVDIDDRRYQARAKQHVAQVYYNANDFEACEYAAKTAIEIFETCSDRYAQELFEAYQLLGRTYVHRGEFKKALDVMYCGQKLAQRTDNGWLEGHARLGASGAHYGEMDISAAKKAAHLAQELFQEEGCLRSEAKVYQLALSEYAKIEGNNDLAVRYVQDAIRIMEENCDHKMCCYLQIRLSQLLQEAGDEEEAAKASMRALKLARMEEDKRQVAQSLFHVLAANFAILNAQPDTETKAFRQQTEKMARYAKEALGLSVKFRDATCEAHANLWVARMHMMMGRAREAVTAAEHSHQIYVERGELMSELDAQFVLGNALEHCGETEQAVAQLQDCIQRCAEHGYDAIEAAAADLLQQIGASLEGSQKERHRTTLMQPERTVSVSRQHNLPEPARVRATIGEKLRELSGSLEIDVDAPILESGIDSLTSVELRTQLQQEFRVSLPSTVIHNYPSIGSMAALIMEELRTKGSEWHS